MCCISMITLFAQDVSVADKINAIKLDTKNYIYAEATMEKSEEAFDVATELLENYIREYALKDNSFKLKDTVVVRNIARKSYRLQMRRGEMYRAFVYVKRNDVMPASNGIVLAKEDKKDIKTDVIQVMPPTPQKGSLEVLEKSRQETIDKLINSGTAENAYAMLSDLKIQNKIISFGMPKDCKDASQSYWLIADKQGKVITVLGKGNSERTNFKEKRLDSLSNYHDIAIWFTM